LLDTTTNSTARREESLLTVPNLANQDWDFN